MKLIHLVYVACISTLVGCAAAPPDDSATSTNDDSTVPTPVPVPMPVVAEAEPNNDVAHANEVGNSSFALSGTVTVGDVDYFHGTVDPTFRQLRADWQKNKAGLQIDMILDRDPSTVTTVFAADGNVGMIPRLRPGEGFLLKMTAPNATHPITYAFQWNYADDPSH